MSKSLTATVDAVRDYYRPLTAIVFFSDESSPARTVRLTDHTQRMPEPPAGSWFLLTGTVVDEANRPLGGVTVDVATGANAGRTATTDGSGAFRLRDLRPGTFPVRFSKPDYAATSTPVFLTSNVTFRMRLTR